MHPKYVMEAGTSKSAIVTPSPNSSMSSSGSGDGTSFGPPRIAVMKWMKPYPCLLQLPDLLGGKKQKTDIDKSKENEVSLQMTMTAKNMRI